ncbi:capping protein inhibiting regulator of actin dynamics isoform X5 [Scyliorhinus canicula]|uniref:capping protein inhibiting regulator of actin dynamics isoform X5 n=1 Tax=Scyliorhinus canicula TaxID=7830 RepID=UPI0018F7A6FE|nr:capping protein inhibiting regulator of actin dynamics isoform X5 [Scyliorhinus canicula]
MTTEIMDTKQDVNAKCTDTDAAEKKKQGKFQPLRKLFGKKRRKVPPIIPEKVNLKSSQSTGDVRNGIGSADGEHEDELRSANTSMGARALSHDSVFIPEGSAGDGARTEVTFQENLPGKIQTLQRQLAKNIKFGQPPPSIIGNRMEDTGKNSEVDGFLQSPLEQSVLQETQLSGSTLKSNDPSDRLNSLCLGGTGSETEEQVTPVRSSWPTSPLSPVSSGGTIESINLDAVPQSMSRLDNAAAKHKLSVKPRNQRISKKPGRLAREKRSITIHEIDCKLEEKEQIPPENEEKQNKIEEEKAQEQKRHHKDEEQRDRGEAKMLKWQEAEQIHHELEGQKRWEDEQKQDTEEQRIQEEDERHWEMGEQKLNEPKQKSNEAEQQKSYEVGQMCGEMEEQKIHEEEQTYCKLEDQKLHDEEQKCEAKEQNFHEEEQQCEMEEQGLNEDENKCHQLEKENTEAEKQYHDEVKMKEEEQKCVEAEDLTQKQRKEEQHFPAAEDKHLNEEQRKEDLEGQKQQKEIERQDDWKEQQREEEQNQEEAELLNQEEQRFLEAQEEEQRRGELRWKEVDQRQTMPSPFSFQVASVEKQIIFQKVNLTPVTHPRETVPPSDVNDLQSSKSGKGLSSSIYVPHTAILVTGAQLCSTAVDLKQIKDTACKTLLGFSEERKIADLPPVEKPNKSNQDTRIGKSKFNPEQSVDQSRSTALTEWASIRAKILKSSDERFQERRARGRFSDDWTTFRASGVHSSLRKTLSANAKFSITPAWQKWADGNKINDSEKINISHETEKQDTPEETVLARNCTMDSSESRRSLTSGDIVQDVAKDMKDDSDSDNHIRIADATEGYKFAKDLPSFLVPSLPATPRKEHSLPQAQPPVFNQAATNLITQTEGQMDTSPFGIKLRRTHYSLRFHYEQQGEQKRKKRYSAGDSMEGIPAFLASKEKEHESCTVSEKPVLQSRHSLDSSRLMDRMESAQPLWITLAMQKQKGFREQQASREERRQAREAKLVEKQAKENTLVSSSMDNKGGNHYMSALQKSSQDEEKKIGSKIMSKVERREHLKKSATLPNSVTVEICDSLASTPAAKELPNRFSTPDAAPVSVEPAWLALAKRKAKAWSDCPQIIK